MHRILSLGDSYTIGEGVSPGQRWPEQLVLALRDAGSSVADPVIVARTGWTTEELLARLDADPPRAPFDLVTLLIGVNDQYRGYAIERYRTGFTQLLGRAASFARGDARRVLVLSIPDWGRTPFAADRDAGGIAREIDAFNAVNRSESLRAGAAYVDVTEMTRARDAESNATVDDGLHPAPHVYAGWAQLALPTALRILAAGAAAQPAG